MQPGRVEPRPCNRKDEIEKMNHEGEKNPQDRKPEDIKKLRCHQCEDRRRKTDCRYADIADDISHASEGLYDPSDPSSRNEEDEADHEKGDGDRKEPAGELGHKKKNKAEKARKDDKVSRFFHPDMGMAVFHPLPDSDEKPENHVGGTQGNGEDHHRKNSLGPLEPQGAEMKKAVADVSEKFAPYGSPQDTPVRGSPTKDRLPLCGHS